MNPEWKKILYTSIASTMIASGLTTLGYLIKQSMPLIDWLDNPSETGIPSQYLTLKQQPTRLSNNPINNISQNEFSKLVREYTTEEKVIIIVDCLGRMEYLCNGGISIYNGTGDNAILEGQRKGSDEIIVFPPIPDRKIKQQGPQFDLLRRTSQKQVLNPRSWELKCIKDKRKDIFNCKNY